LTDKIVRRGVWLEIKTTKMDVKIKSVFHYVGAGFTFGFFVSLAGLAFENSRHNIPLEHAFTSPVHFIMPLIMGLATGLLAFFYRKRRAEKVRVVNEYSKNLNSLLEVNYALISSIDLDVVLQVIVDKSVRLLSLDTGAIYLHENEKIYLGATTPPLPNEFPEALRFDLLENHPTIRKSIETKTAVSIYDAHEALLSEAEREIVKVRNLRSVLYIPLFIEQRSIGTLILGTTLSTRAFSDDETKLCSAFTSLSALAIENSRLYKRSKIIANELRKKNDEFLSLNELLNESNFRIQKINEDLRISKERAEESDRLKTSFLQNMSHEVRTPLNAIVGFAQLIAEPNRTNGKNRLFSDKIISGSDKLIGIITDVIEISQIQANQVQMKSAELNLIALINSIVNKYEKRAAEKEIAFVFRQNVPYKELIVKSDGEKLKKILSHLIHNALKFTQAGTVEIRCKLVDSELQISVSDTGIGISLEQQNIIFDPFRQVETGLIRSYGGNGIGLSLVKAYTELLNGSVSVKSRLGSGTTFDIALPLNIIEAKPDDKMLTSVEVDAPPFIVASAVDTILIVDDEYSNYLYLYELLQPTHIEILHASNGKQAVDICRTNNAVGLILMDIKMPIMDGATAAKLIREFRPSLPIIAQTAYTLEHEKLDNVKVFNDYIIKPINKYEFQQKMMVYVDR